jgi:hypothetical protein
MRTSPLPFVAAPHACVDRFADDTIAQSMVFMSESAKRM